ncbi:MAG: aminotransferase class III-fold pyridoxal phosphate-dependent enzyme [Clostridia bacterium]|nr:aminotransferase class III-fold pyridoxal phosphate-dependent enzyme [Clostridia bacterium]
MLIMSKIREMDLKYNLHSWNKQSGLKPEVITKAEGIYLWNEEGKRFYDMSAQLVNMNLGHGHKKVIQAIKDQAEKLAFIAPSYACDVRSEAAKKLVELAPDYMSKVFFTNAGAEANENAIKMARMYTGRNKIFSAYRSYHGATHGAANLTGEARRQYAEPGMPGFIKFEGPYAYRAPKQVKFESEADVAAYYLEILENQIIYEGTDKVAAIFFETVVGSNGVLIPPKGYYEGVREICDKYGILMVFDEVMAGFGRTGTMFAFENYNGKPDLITFAKGSTCGYAPLGGVIVSDKIAKHFDENILGCGLTYNGHPLGCAAAIATIDAYIEENIFDNVNQLSGVLGEILEEIKEKHACVGDVRYVGLFSMIELVKDKETKEPMVPFGQDPDGTMAKIIGMLKSEGFVTYKMNNMLAVSPPLIITEEELREAMKIMDNVLDSVDNMIR